MDPKDNKYTLEQFIEFLRVMYCMSYERFLKMYKILFGEYCDSYAREKFELMNRRGPSGLICELDYDTLSTMIELTIIDKSI